MRYKGFSTAENLLVVATIAILAAIIVIAVTANEKLVDTRNTQRQTDVATILSAVTRYAIDHQGHYPEILPTNLTEICRSDADDCTGLVDLDLLTENNTYLEALPVDPHSDSPNGTGYLIQRSGRYRISVIAPLAEDGLEISKAQ